MGSIPKSNFEKILVELQKQGVDDVDTDSINKALVAIRRERGSFQGLRKREFAELIIANLKGCCKEKSTCHEPLQNFVRENQEKQLSLVAS